MTSEPQMIRKTRPVNLNLFTFHFPVTAIVSILHRVTGVFLFLLIPFVIWVFGLSLSSPDNFSYIQSYSSLIIVKAFVWCFLVALFYHLVAGLRHLIMDFGVGESLFAGRLNAWLVLLISVVFAILLGIFLW